MYPAMMNNLPTLVIDLIPAPENSRDAKSKIKEKVRLEEDRRVVLRTSR